MTEGESKLKFPTKSGLERLNSNKMEESIYIKKSTLLEIQERHENEGHGMDMSLLRIFQDNKNKVPPSAPTGVPGRSDRSRICPHLLGSRRCVHGSHLDLCGRLQVKPTNKSMQKEHTAPEKQASLGTLINSIAGPPRYDDDNPDAGMSVGPGMSVMTSGLYSQDCSAVSDDLSNAPLSRLGSARSDRSSGRSALVMGAGVPSLAKKASMRVMHGAAAAFAPTASPSARGQRNPNKLFGQSSQSSSPEPVLLPDSPDILVGLSSERSNASQDAVEESNGSQPLVSGAVSVSKTTVRARIRPVHGRDSPRHSPALTPEASAAESV